MIMNDVDRPQKIQQMRHYGYAGMNRDQAYRAYMGLTCNNPPVTQVEREARIAVLKELMNELRDREQESDVDEATATAAGGIASVLTALDDRIAVLNAAIAGNTIIDGGSLFIRGASDAVVLHGLSGAESKQVWTLMLGIAQARRAALSAQLTAMS